MSSEIRRLSVSDREELIEVLDYSFTNDRHSGYFEAILPKMWLDDEFYLPRHLAMFEDGKMVAALGIYPYETTIAGEKLLFSTVGNVATIPDAQGKGYMQRLLTAAMQELEEIGADVSRLGGVRSRYARFGYEPCGTVYDFVLKKRNAKEFLADKGEGSIRFEKLDKGDKKALDFIRSLQNARVFRTERGDDDGLFAVLCAWRSVPYVAYCGDELVGYISASPSGDHIAEIDGISDEIKVEMLCRFALAGDAESVTIGIYPSDVGLSRPLTRICESFSANIASQFKIINWEKLTRACFKLKNSITPLPEGEISIGIEDYGTLRLSVENGEAKCEKVQGSGDILLDRKTASRFIFGPYSPEGTAELPQEKATLFASYLPLPLSWNDLDRV